MARCLRTTHSHTVRNATPATQIIESSQSSCTYLQLAISRSERKHRGEPPRAALGTHTIMCTQAQAAHGHDASRVPATACVRRTVSHCVPQWGTVSAPDAPPTTPAGVLRTKHMYAYLVLTTVR